MEASIRVADLAREALKAALISLMALTARTADPGFSRPVVQSRSRWCVLRWGVCFLVTGAILLPMDASQLEIADIKSFHELGCPAMQARYIMP